MIWQNIQHFIQETLLNMEASELVNRDLSCFSLPSRIRSVQRMTLPLAPKGMLEGTITHYQNLAPEVVENIVTSAVLSILGAVNVFSYTPLMDAGVDSLSATELVQQLAT